MRIFDSIKNVIRWFPIIWNDRDWDYYFLYIILHTKLSHMEKYIRKHGHHIGCERDADNIKVAVSLLDRLIKDDHLDNAMKQHREKWGRMKFNFIDIDGNGSRLETTYGKAKTEEDRKKAEKEFRRCAKHSEYMLERDLDLLFKVMRKHIRHWWD